MKVAQETICNALILFFRIASVLFLLAYPLVKVAWKIVSQPWLIGYLGHGIELTFAPLRELATRVHEPALELSHQSLLLPSPVESPKADLNCATVEELRVIEGIGFVKALEIVEYRERYGDYRRIEELGMIPGIGSKTLHVLAERFEVKNTLDSRPGIQTH